MNLLTPHRRNIDMLHRILINWNSKSTKNIYTTLQKLFLKSSPPLRVGEITLQPLTASRPASTYILPARTPPPPKPQRPTMAQLVRRVKSNFKLYR
ncbi:hypothetical protein BpHYR1_037371 [Brachionus plicatilis]|uniref:RNA-directed DNA polymerase from mobile element jockey-like n=1 Tax=Brachionus plicatilis TaxID=10195 RepID=A0A3M7S4T7_BRAPC|nr:hypothetical protein BpHYR1_037371 [Brachionus plicatilis]